MCFHEPMLGKLQLDLVKLLGGAGDDPPTLFGGAAILGTHASHRETHDLDFFWSPASTLGRRAAEVTARLEAAGFATERITTSPAFVRIRVSAGGESVVVDLVAEPRPRRREQVAIEGVDVWASPRADLLTNKLCSLLSRQEGRDLWDVRVLLEAGEDLEAAIARAPDEDAGFSPLTLAWVLRDWPMHAVAQASGWEPELRDRLSVFRDELVERLIRPPEGVR